MEKKIQAKHKQFISHYKKAATDPLLELLQNNILDSSVKNMLEQHIQFIYDYNTDIFTKQDFEKKKRVRNIVKCDERCKAFRANGEQCTRRRKNDDYCGTHMKGLPHGHLVCDTNKKTQKQIKVWEEEINGISYYIDKDNNVYDTYDILENKTSPSVINKYTTRYDEANDKTIFSLVN